MAAKAARVKTENSTNKSQAIRDTVVELGKKSRPRDVIAKLKSQGIDVSAALVTNVMARSGKRRPRRATRTAGIGRTTCADNLTMESLLSAKRLLDQVGSVEEAKRALDVLAKLI